MDRFCGWYTDHQQGDFSGPLRATLIAGGRSNLTYEISDGKTSRILRRPPIGHVQATAHDMRREFTMMEALAGTAVPVPRVYAFCDDLSVLGAPFYVMERVSGIPYRDASELAELGSLQTTEICKSMVDSLVDLHAVRPGDVGLSDFARPSGFVARQVSRWGAQMAGSHHRTLLGSSELLEMLETQAPRIADVSLLDGTATIVHGDYRLDNLLIEGSEVRAVLDWEMATLGDPLTDLAMLVVYSSLAEVIDVPELGDACLAPGFLGPQATIDLYCEGSRISASSLDFYLGLAYYKLATILEGIHLRFLQGRTPGGAFGSVGDAVEPLLDEGHKALVRYRHADTKPSLPSA